MWIYSFRPTNLQRIFETHRKEEFITKRAASFETAPLFLSEHLSVVFELDYEL